MRDGDQCREHDQNGDDIPEIGKPPFGGQRLLGLGGHQALTGMRETCYRGLCWVVTIATRGNRVTAQSILPGDASQDVQLAQGDSASVAGHDIVFLPGAHLLVDGLTRAANEAPKICV